MSRQQRPITDREIKVWLAAGAVDRGVGEGLTFVASTIAARAGKASWILRYQLNGRSKEKALGRYPGVNAQARNRGLQRMPVCGLNKVRCVALLFALAHNLMRTPALAPQLLGLGTTPSAAGAGTV